MFGLDSPRLLGSWAAVRAATLPSNKFYLLYILPCVEILFQPAYGPQHLMARTGISRGISFPTSSPHSLGPSVNRQVAVEATEELWPAPYPVCSEGSKIGRASCRERV